MPYNPTAENMARYLLEEAAPVFMDGSGGKIVRVRIWETEESYAEATLDVSPSERAETLQEAIAF